MSSVTPREHGSAADPAALSVRNLTVTAGARRGVPVVRDVSFDLRPGEILGVVGESGSGKTLTALSILRLLPRGVQITHGEVLFDGEDLVRASPERMRATRGRDIAMVFQDPGRALNPVHRIGRQIAEPLLIHRLAARRALAGLVTGAMMKVGIPAASQRMSSYPFEFSGGMRQRALISMALVCQPRVLIADEPTTGLDVTIQIQVLNLIRSLATDLNMSTLLVSHDLNMIARVCDRVQVMYAGQIVESGPIGEVLQRPRHPYTEALVRAVPTRGTPAGEQLFTLPGVPLEPSVERDGCSLFERCSYRREICAHSEPSLLGVADDHLAACWVTQAGEELTNA